MGDRVFITRTTGDSSFRSAARLGLWGGGRGGQASLGWGSPAAGGAGVRESPDLGGAGGPCTYLVPFDELTPAPQGLHDGGRLQLQRVDAGPGARHSWAGGGSGTHGAPTGTRRRRCSLRALPRGPLRPGGVTARPPASLSGTDRRIGGARPGRGGGGAAAAPPPPPASGPPAPRRLPLAAGVATATRGGMGQRHARTGALRWGWLS